MERRKSGCVKQLDISLGVLGRDTENHLCRVYGVVAKKLCSKDIEHSERQDPTSVAHQAQQTSQRCADAIAILHRHSESPLCPVVIEHSTDEYVK